MTPEIMCEKCFGLPETNNDNTAPAVAVVSSAIVRQVLETCAAAGVEKVIAADHHGMIFLLSNGPEQIGGIVYRDDDLKYSGMKTLASEVNAALLPNDLAHTQKGRERGPNNTQD
jgi:hypothetical protein